MLRLATGVHILGIKHYKHLHVFEALQASTGTYMFSWTVSQMQAVLLSL